MTHWNSGYMAEIDYTFGYYFELNPLKVKLAFLNAGLVAPSSGAACELGFGQGLSANIHAAASVTQWFGTDFNPSQAGFAQEMASISGSAAALYEQSFAEFCGRSDLPDFDYIALHGIWSWISDENRSTIIDFVRRKLKAGGVLYISYNTLPGWAAFAPMRHLLSEHAETIGADGQGIISRVRNALEFSEKLLAVNPAFARANPQIAERLKSIKGQDQTYLAHEYFNREWEPMHFSTMAKWLTGAKLNFACSANFLDHFDFLNLTNEQQAFLGEITDPMFRETTRDFIVNQQFRRDYWVKGARKLSASERAEQCRDLKMVLVTPRVEVPTKVSAVLGEASLNEAVYSPILDLLADHRPQSVREIEEALTNKGIGLPHIVQAITILAGAGHLTMAQDAAIAAQVKKQTDQLNRYFMRKARGTNDIGYLASPVTGGGVSVNRFQQLFLLAGTEGMESPDEWAKYAWQILSAENQRVLKDGKALESAEQNLAELVRQASEFAEKRLNLLRCLQVI
jgi:SAM-dependent methyltransferase